MLALVTGAGRGIGLAAAEKLKEYGYEVIGVAHRSDCDLSDAGQVARMAEEVLRGRDEMLYVVGDVYYRTMAEAIGEAFAAGEHAEDVDTIGGMIFNTCRCAFNKIF